MTDEIKYVLEYKRVKNINLRILPDGTVRVSANKRVPKKVIDDFVQSKSNFIRKALERAEKRAEIPKKQYFSESGIRQVVISLCEKHYSYFEKKGVKYPEIRFRKMVSQWGNCHRSKHRLTFNTNLMYAPIECVEYVVLHEFTHFLVNDHSKRFYAEVEKVCPDWKLHVKRLKEINIR